MKPDIQTLNQSTAGSLHRRDFLQLAASFAVGLSASGRVDAQSVSVPRVPLGLDAHSLRSMKWNASQLVEYAAEQKLDAVLLNNFGLFVTRETPYLESLKQTADARELKLYLAAGSISEGSITFSDKFGGAQGLLAEGIRVAKAIGSPSVNVRIGNVDDRYSKGGIEARIEESVKVLKALRTRAQDAGVTFAFENHAADLRSEELLGLIEAAGTDICGVMLDPGNALWAMEDPMKHIQKLGRYVLCTSVRDYMIWESEERATFQWTAIGDGLMDSPAYTQYMATLCPNVPLFVETISNSPRTIPFLKADFWKAYPNVRAKDIVDFLALLRRGHPIEVARAPAPMDVKTFEQQNQRSEFEKSIAYLRRHCGAGRKRIS